MRFVIRADASTEIGFGHVMRCLSLAVALSKKGEEVSFICKNLEGNLIQHIENKGFDCELLDYLFIKGWELDAKACNNIITEKYSRADWVIVDHYGLDKKWEFELKKVSGKILAFDDLAEQEHDVDFILNQNDHCSERNYEKTAPKASLLLGSKYSILRDSFIDNKKTFEYREKAKRIFVNFGSYDQTLSSIKVLKACIHLLKVKGFENLEVLVLYGKDEGLKQKIIPFCKEIHELELMSFKEDLVEDLQKADLAIGAGGTSLLERFNVGIPNLVISTANNQTAICEKLSLEQKIIYLGEAGSVSVDYMQSAIHFLLESSIQRKILIEKTKELVDGKGLERLCNVLRTNIRFSLASILDAKLIFEWRNHSQNRSVSLSNDIIEYENHLAWVKKSIKDSNRILLFAKNLTDNIGVCRLDIDGVEAVVSIYLKPNTVSLGLGQLVLNSLISWVKENTTIQKLNADIKPDNIKSIKIFERAGFRSYKMDFELIL